MKIQESNIKTFENFLIVNEQGSNFSLIHSFFLIQNNYVNYVMFITLCLRTHGIRWLK